MRCRTPPHHRARWCCNILSTVLTVTAHTTPHTCPTARFAHLPVLCWDVPLLRSRIQRVPRLPAHPTPPPPPARHLTVTFQPQRMGWFSGGFAPHHVSPAACDTYTCLDGNIGCHSGRYLRVHTCAQHAPHRRHVAPHYPTPLHAPPAGPTCIPSHFPFGCIPCWVGLVVEPPSPPFPRPLYTTCLCPIAPTPHIALPHTWRNMPKPVRLDGQLDGWAAPCHTRHPPPTQP